MSRTSMYLMYIGGAAMVVLGLTLPLMGSTNMILNLVVAMLGGLLIGSGINRGREIKQYEAEQAAKQKKKKEIHITYRK